ITAVAAHDANCPRCNCHCDTPGSAEHPPAKLHDGGPPTPPPTTKKAASRRRRRWRLGWQGGSPLWPRGSASPPFGGVALSSVIVMSVPSPVRGRFAHTFVSTALSSGLSATLREIPLLRGAGFQARRVPPGGPKESCWRRTEYELEQG